VQRQLSYVHYVVLVHGEGALSHVLIRTYFCYLACVAPVPRFDFLQTLTVNFTFNLSDDVDRIELGNAARPACADTFSTVDQDHGDDRHVVGRLDR
jgi:hypothetical protein